MIPLLKLLPIFRTISNGLKLLLPDRALKFFPPDFTVRRPLLSLLNKNLCGDTECYVALFRLEFSRLQHEVPEPVWTLLRHSARQLMRQASEKLLGDDEFIAADQFERTDFILLLKQRSDFLNPGTGISRALKDKLEKIRLELETGLQNAAPDWQFNLRVKSAIVPLSDEDEFQSPAEMLKESYRLALALATGQTVPQTEGLRKQLERILDQGAISVLAQPIMNLTSGDIYGWEILARGPEDSFFHMPDELFRFASQTRLLSRLEFMIVNRALDEAASRGIREPVFLNVTAVTLAHPLFLQHVLKCLDRHPLLTPRHIFFEITERHEVLDLEAMARILASFRKRGFRFAVDDAGAGYSSLQWIGELVPELIKIDRSVIRHVDRVAVKESMLKALVSIAKEIQCEVVAEGVEREEEADVLFRHDIGMGQGYYFARPNVLLHEHERGIFQETKERIQHRRRAAS